MHLQGCQRYLHRLSPPPVTQTAVPVSPAGIRLASFSVAGGYLSLPTIIQSPLNATEDETSGVGSGFDSIPVVPISYQLILASFQVSYIVNNCEVGLPLLLGSYDNLDYDVMVERLTAASPAISGTFDLSFNGRTIQSISADTSTSLLEQLLEANFPEEGGMWEGGKRCVVVRGGRREEVCGKEGEVCGREGGEVWARGRRGV